MQNSFAITSFGRLAHVVVASTLALALMLVLAAPAMAAESTTYNGNSAQRSSTTAPQDEICQQARTQDKKPGRCSIRNTTAVSAAETVTAATVDANDLQAVSTAGNTLEAAMAAGTVYTRTWWQEKRGLYYVNWVEKHTGRIYWDGSQVWSTTSNRGYQGTHVCDQGFGILYDINVTNCSTERLGTTSLNEWDYFRVHVVFKGIPLYASHNMRANANRSGTMTFHS